MKNKTKFLLTTLFILVAFLLLGTTNVNATTVIVENETQLRDAVDGAKEVDGNTVTDTDTTVVQLKNDIVLTDDLLIMPITDFTLDLKGNTIDGETNSKNVSIVYGSNNYDNFTTGSLTIKDTGSSNTGTIKSYKQIFINGRNYNDVAKNFALTIEGGKFYVLKDSTMFGLSGNSYMKNTTFDFQVKDGCFETAGFYGIFLQSENLESMSINLKVKLDKLTFKSYWSRLMYSGGDKEFTVNDVVSADSNVVIKKTSGTEESSELTDRTHSVSEYLAFIDVLDTYDTIEIVKTEGFDVSDVTLNETYGFTAETATPVEIPIKNRGTSDLKIKNVTVDDSRFKIVDGTETNLSAGATDTTWKVQANASLSKGTYTATITVEDEAGKTYTSTVTLNVSAKTLTEISIYVPSEVTYENTYTPTPNFNGFTGLTVDDYTITFAKKDGATYTNIDYTPSDVGEYRAILKVTNENYIADDATVDFKIVAKTITPTVDAIADEQYTGEQITPDVIVSHDSTTLVKDTDYTVEYDTNKAIGTGKVTIKAVSGRNYTFTDIEKTFNIVARTLTDGDVTLTQTSYRHTGSYIKPEPVVKVGDKTLVAGTDYELSYSDNIEKGNNTAKVTVTGKGNYTGTIDIYFSIIEKEPQVISFAETDVTKTYGDSDFTITANHTTGDGAVTYTSTNTDVATVNATTGKVTILKAGNATIKATANATTDYAEETAEYTLTVEKKELSFTATVNNKAFDNKKTATVSGITFTGLVGSESLTKDTDYTVSAEFASASVGNNIDVNVTVTLKDSDITKNYTLASTSSTVKANITGKEIVESGVTVDTDTTYTYTGSEIKPDVIVKDGTTTLTEGTDYSVVYSNNIDAGMGKVKITGMGNYSGVIEKQFRIYSKHITPSVEAIADVTYNGTQHKPVVVVKDGTTVLEKGTDYTTTYGSNTSVGTGTVTIASISGTNYVFDEVTETFNIVEKTLSDGDVSLSQTSFRYTGSAITPEPVVKDGDNTLVKGTDYELSYSNNINAGENTAKVTVTGKGNYKGTVNKNFSIVEKTLLNITGMDDNQTITYTGSPVVLVGTLQVDNGFTADDLIETWYNEAGTDEISKPTNVGKYQVVYSYEDDDFKGDKVIIVEITKKTSTVPSVDTYKGIAGNKLSTITLPNGFKWVNSDEEITAGNKNYNAKYTTNNDTTNYTTEDTTIKVYGKSNVNVNVSVNGVGGGIDSNKTTMLEGETATITFSTADGYEISKVEVNGVDKTSSVKNKKLNVVAGNTDVTVVVTYKVIQYTITINDVENATINPKGIVKVDYNTNKEFTIKADAGYKLVSVKVNGVERKSDIVNDKLTLENILANAEIVVVVEKNVYEVIDGANQKYTITKNSEAKFRIDADYSKFENGGKVYVDGELVDAKNYTSKSGSTIITLKQAYVDTLSVGEHTLKVVFNDGGEATTNFTIAKVAEQQTTTNVDNSSNPKTFDNIMVYVAIAMISVVGLGATVVIKKKQAK